MVVLGVDVPPSVVQLVLHLEHGHGDGLAGGLAGDPLVPVHLDLLPNSLWQNFALYLEKVVGRRLSVLQMGHGGDGLLHGPLLEHVHGLGGDLHLPGHGDGRLGHAHLALQLLRQSLRPKLQPKIRHHRSYFLGHFQALLPSISSFPSLFWLLQPLLLLQSQCSSQEFLVTAVLASGGLGTSLNLIRLGTAPGQGFAKICGPPQARLLSLRHGKDGGLVPGHLAGLLQGVI